MLTTQKKDLHPSLSLSWPDSFKDQYYINTISINIKEQLDPWAKFCILNKVYNHGDNHVGLGMSYYEP